MQAAGIDYLLVQCHQTINGYVRWFADFSSAGFHTTILFPLDGEMTLIAHGPKPPAPAMMPPKAMRRGISEVVNVPSWPGTSWQNDWHGKEVAKALSRRNKSSGTIGFVGLGYMSAALYETTKKELPSWKFVDAQNLVDEVKMIKSEEEIMLIKLSGDMHVKAYELAKQAVRPGKLARDVIEEIRSEQVRLGSEDQEMIIWFGHPEKSYYVQPIQGATWIRRPFKEGDYVDFLIESRGIGGYFYNLRRTLYIGSSVPKEVRDAHELCKEAQRLLASNCKTGMSPAAARRANDDFLKSKGYPEELRVLGHGQGIDLVERPVVDEGETVEKLERGMTMALHPTATNTFASICLSDNFLVTDSGAVPIHPQMYDDIDIATVG